MLGTIFRSQGERRQAETDLRDLLAEVREEREAVRDERAALRVQTEQAASAAGRLSRTNKALEELSGKTEAALRRLDKLNGAVDGFEERTRRLEKLDTRVSELAGQVLQAEQAAKALAGPEGPLQRHGKALDELGAQVRDAQAALSLLRQESAELGGTQAQLRQVGAELQRSLGGITAIKAEFTELRGLEQELRRDVDDTRELAKEARTDSTTAMGTLKDVSSRLDALAQLQDLSTDTDKRIAALQALAEHVTQKAKVLETQRHTIDHAAAETARLNQMVWTMDAQIAKLMESRDQMQQAEEAVQRIEHLARAAAKDLAAARTERDAFAKESARLEAEARTLLGGLRQTVERLGLDKAEFGALDERLRSLSGALAQMETRVQGVLERDESLAAMQHKADALDKVFGELRADTEDLARRQNALDELTEQLGLVEALGRRTAAQHDRLLGAQGDLEAMQRQLGELQEAYGEASRMRPKLAQDREAFEEFEQRTVAMIGRTPEIEARLEAVLGKFSLLEQGTEAARKLAEDVAGLDTELARVAARVQFIERLDERVSGLFALTRNVEQMMGQQAARHAELDGLAQQCESLESRLNLAQQQLEGLWSQQARLQPLAAEVSRIEDAVRGAQRMVTTMKNDEAEAVEQRARLAGLIEHGLRQAADTSERLRHVQVLSEDLAQAAARGDEALAQLAQVQVRQREVLSQVGLAEEQLQRAEGLSRQLEHRRTLLVQAEKSLKSFEVRLADLDRHAEGLEAKMKTLAEREAMVQAVKSEVDGIREISSRSKADLQHVIEHRGDVAELRAKVDELLERLSDADRKAELVEGWRRKVDEAQAGAGAVTAMLGDMQGTLESLSEQRVVIDDVADKLARLELTVQEAQAMLSRLDGSNQEAQITLRTLQRERDVAEKVEKSIKSLRRPGTGTG